MGQAHCFIEVQLAVVGLDNLPTLPLRPRFIWSRANYAAISSHVAAVDWETEFNALNVNDSYQLLVNVYNEAINLYIQTITTPFTKKQEEWVIADLIKAVKAKRASWAKFVNAGRDAHQLLKESHRIACKNITKMVKSARLNYERKLAKPKGPLSAFESRTEAICVVDPTSFSIDIVQKCLYQLDERKSTGYDCLHPRVLSKCATSFAQSLSLIYKCSFMTGVVPNLWRKSNVTAIFKKGSKINASNYRPISLTSISCKIIESILKTSIMELCVANELITPEQHGFVYRNGCVSNLLETRDTMTEAIHCSHAVDVIYTDFTKAFDKVPHKRLFHKLRAYGIQSTGSQLGYKTEVND
ncbi:uncharacterized protein LOC124815526 [Hydra vulgaris]|uniref:uncharacterized protein LOC124815526 n=1 Tax=Hydra vulgaris TaxID=6087 RepID=UPI001F5EED76|nr:uncharacterized protein LOC124815526 [Hydra vulgaris]